MPMCRICRLGRAAAIVAATADRLDFQRLRVVAMVVTMSSRAAIDAQLALGMGNATLADFLMKCTLGLLQSAIVATLETVFRGPIALRHGNSAIEAGLWRRKDVRPHTSCFPRRRRPFDSGNRSGHSSHKVMRPPVRLTIRDARFGGTDPRKIQLATAGCVTPIAAAKEPWLPNISIALRNASMRSILHHDE